MRFVLSFFRASRGVNSWALATVNAPTLQREVRPTQLTCVTFSSLCACSFQSTALVQWKSQKAHEKTGTRPRLSVKARPVSFRWRLITRGTLTARKERIGDSRKRNRYSGRASETGNEKSGLHRREARGVVGAWTSVMLELCTRGAGVDYKASRWAGISVGAGDYREIKSDWDPNSTHLPELL